MRELQAAELTHCDREPIHLTDAIQPHGVLLAVRETDLIVLRASANCERHLGVTPKEAIGAPLALVLGEMAVARLRDCLVDPRSSGFDPQVFRPIRGSASYEMTWFRSDGLLVLELEPNDAAESMPMMALFADVRHATQILQAAHSTTGLYATLAAEIKHLTGYDRVMVYRFHEDWHGEVVAEEREADLEPLLGLHYPAADIPRPARRLYLSNHLRVIRNVEYEPVPLLGLPGLPDQPLDLSLSGLRSAQPAYLRYLQNMNVRATMTISLMEGTRLWGLVACHHCSPKRIDAQLRAACRMLGQVFSLQVISREVYDRDFYRARLAKVQAQVVGAMSGAEFLAGGLRAAEPLPLELVAADGMIARLGTVTVQMGSVPPAPAVQMLLRRLQAAEEPAELVCDDLPHRFPELTPFTACAAGLLALPLSGAYEEYILWFRGEYVRSITWVGDHNQPAGQQPFIEIGRPRLIRLGPQASFEAWSLDVRGRSRPWLAAGSAG